MLHLVTAGALPGEHAAAMRVQPCSAVTLCECSLLVLPTSALEALPGLRRALMEQLAERSVLLMDRLEQQARFSAQQLLAASCCNTRRWTGHSI